MCNAAHEQRPLPQANCSLISSFSILIGISFSQGSLLIIVFPLKSYYRNNFKSKTTEQATQQTQAAQSGSFTRNLPDLGSAPQASTSCHPQGSHNSEQLKMSPAKQSVACRVSLLIRNTKQNVCKLGAHVCFAQDMAQGIPGRHEVMTSRLPHSWCENLMVTEGPSQTSP